MTLKSVEIDIDENDGEIVKIYALQENHWWSVDYFLTPIILDALLQFREKHKDGVPSSLVYLDGEEYSDDAEYDTRYSEARKKWEEILDKIVLAFTLIKKDQDGEIPEYYNDTTYDYDVDLYNLQQDQIEEGLALFGKYYRGLWD